MKAAPCPNIFSLLLIITFGYCAAKLFIIYRKVKVHNHKAVQAPNGAKASNDLQFKPTPYNFTHVLKHIHKPMGITLLKFTEHVVR